MATTTTKLGLRKPDPDPSTGDFISVTTDINQSMDKIDAAMSTFICTSGTRPTGADRWDGREIYETDTRRRFMWANGLSAWLPILNGRTVDGPFQMGAANTDTVGQGLNVQATTSPVDIFRSKNVGDSNARFLITDSGQFKWGSGSAGADTEFGRTAASELGTPVGDALRVSGDLVCGSENGVSALSTTSGTDTTTSATYVNMAGTGSVTSFSFTKRWTATRVYVEMHQVLYQSGGSFPFCQLGVRINSVDYDVVGAIISTAGTGTMFSGIKYVAASAVPAGTYTVQARWKRVSGTGTLTRDNATWLSFSCRECN